MTFVFHKIRKVLAGEERVTKNLNN